MDLKQVIIGVIVGIALVTATAVSITEYEALGLQSSLKRFCYMNGVRIGRLEQKQELEAPSTITPVTGDCLYYGTAGWYEEKCQAPILSCTTNGWSMGSSGMCVMANGIALPRTYPKLEAAKASTERLCGAER